MLKKCKKGRGKAGGGGRGEGGLSLKFLKKERGVQIFPIKMEGLVK